MRIRKRKVGVFVIEAGDIEPDNVRIPAAVLAMTGFALRHRNVRQSAVHATFAIHVRGNVLVATQAQRCLPRTIAAIMALGAGGLELGVRRADLARRKQTFQRRCIGGAWLHHA